MVNTTKKVLSFTGFFLLLLAFAACTSPKKMVYMYDLGVSDTGSIKVARSNFEAAIQKNDLLWITVGGTNLADLPMLNSSLGTVSGGGATANSTVGSASIGYLVESDGKIQIPFLGRVNAAGLTRTNLEHFLTEQFKEYTKNPIVNVRYLNQFVTIMGEVMRPGRYNITTERLTIFEALGMAGDLTDFGKRENLLVIREENGERKFERINLLSKSLFESPYFYLRNNDVVYIEPAKVKFISRSGVPQYLSVIAIGVSMLITVINLTRK
jgi:polysaccharide export outer membrane protein